MKRTYLMFFMFLLFTFVHNLISAVLDYEEGVFFSLALVSGLAFIVSLVYTIFLYIKEDRMDELWKFGWLGLIGLSGFLPCFGPLYFGLYGFFGFFGLKK